MDSAQKALECPTCGATRSKNSDSRFTERTLKIHHKNEHGVSIVERNKSECDVCGKGFEYNPSGRLGITCSRECQLEYTRSQREIQTFYKECSWCRDYITRIGQRDFKSRRFCSQDCYSGARAFWYSTALNSGPDNPRWREGEYENGMLQDDWWRNEIRPKILERDDYTCQACGEAESELDYWLTVHHKKPVREFESFREATYEENLITLCLTCHPKVENGKMEVM